MELGDGPEPAPSRLVSRARRVDAPAWLPLRAFDGPRLAWLPPDGPRLVGCGAATTVTAAGPRRFETVRRRLSSLFAAVETGDCDAPGPRVLGGAAFLPDHEQTEPWAGFPAASFVLPALQLVEADGETWLRAQGPDADAVTRRLDAATERLDAAERSVDPTPGVVDTDRTPSRSGWREGVAATIERIRAGALRKAVLASALDVTLGGAFDLSSAVARLDGERDTHRFAVAPGEGGAFFGATPERLASVRGDRVETEALAGSVGRGETSAEDDRLADALRDSEKDQHEHQLVVRAIRERLAARADDVHIGPQSVRRLDSVQHLHTPIEATVPDAHVLDVVAALHPTPAVGGLPPDAALDAIRDAETFERGWYASPVGWVGPDGDGAFAVAIRSAVAEGRRARLYAGNGIVADSDPEEEWREVQLKFEPMLDQLR